MLFEGAVGDWTQGLVLFLNVQIILEKRKKLKSKQNYCYLIINAFQFPASQIACFCCNINHYLSLLKKVLLCPWNFYVLKNISNKNHFVCFWRGREVGIKPRACHLALKFPFRFHMVSKMLASSIFKEIQVTFSWYSKISYSNFFIWILKSKNNLFPVTKFA